MKKILLTAITMMFLTAAPTYASEGTFAEISDPSSPNHICRQLGTKICNMEKCTVKSYNNIPHTQTTTKAAVETTSKTTTEATTKAAAAETTTRTTTEATTETTTKAAVTETTTRTTTEATTETTTVQQNSSYAQQVLNLVNAERAKRSLSPLTLNAGVNKVAQLKAEDMKNNNYFSHTSPTYGSPFDMLKSFGISYKSAGENIAKGQKTPEAVVNAWMNSEGHRANILNKNFREIGIGYTGGSSPYWVQIFIG